MRKGEFDMSISMAIWRYSKHHELLVAKEVDFWRDRMASEYNIREAVRGLFNEDGSSVKVTKGGLLSSMIDESRERRNECVNELRWIVEFRTSSAIVKAKILVNEIFERDVFWTRQSDSDFKGNCIRYYLNGSENDSGDSIAKKTKSIIQKFGLKAVNQ